MEKMWIKWDWTANNGIKFNGMYAGEVKDEKPHGLGKWKRDGSHWTVEGEWKDGLLDGKAVENNIFGHDEYEAKDGKKNGKFIRYFDDGCRGWSEYKDGKYDGRHRKYNEDGVI